MDRSQFQEIRASHEGYQLVHLSAGFEGMERVVPPAGEDYAFNVPRYKRRVEVTVSPTGRSVRVFVDGKEVK